MVVGPGRECLLFIFPPAAPPAPPPPTPPPSRPGFRGGFGRASGWRFPARACSTSVPVGPFQMSGDANCSMRKRKFPPSEVSIRSTSVIAFDGKFGSVVSPEAGRALRPAIRAISRCGRVGVGAVARNACVTATKPDHVDLKTAGAMPRRPSSSGPVTAIPDCYTGAQAARRPRQPPAPANGIDPRSVDQDGLMVCGRMRFDIASAVAVVSRRLPHRVNPSWRSGSRKRPSGCQSMHRASDIRPGGCGHYGLRRSPLIADSPRRGFLLSVEHSARPLRGPGCLVELCSVWPK